MLPQFVGFVVFLLAGTAETARAPFDLPEAEQELVAGYHTEYGGMRFGLFTMSEYINLITLSALCVTLFLGGWHGPWLPGPIWFLLKLFILLFVFIWVRTTVPRLRYDQLMRFGWKVLLPVATLNAVITAILVVAICEPRQPMPQPFSTLKGFGVTFRQIFRKPITQQYPEFKRAGLPALPRPAHAAPARERAREVRRLLALRGGLPVRLHPRRRRREHRREPRLRRRALRAHLRDQPQPLHLLRLLRARVPVRRDHARQPVRDLRVLARRPDLHEGHAADRADQARARAGRRPLRHADPAYIACDETTRESKTLSDFASIRANFLVFLVWVIWIVAALACVSTGVAVISFTNPFYSALALIGNLASLAVLFLLASAEFVAAAQILVYAGAVMVMFLFVIAYLGGRADAPWAGGPRWLQLGAFVVGAALLIEVVVALLTKANGDLADSAEIARSFGSPAEIGRLFLTDHLLAFEITSIVLLVAAVGGVVLGIEVLRGGRLADARPERHLVPRRRGRPLRDRRRRASSSAAAR